MRDMAEGAAPDGVPERLVGAAIRLLAEQGPSAIKARTVASATRAVDDGRLQPLRWNP